MRRFAVFVAAIAMLGATSVRRATAQPTIAVGDRLTQAVEVVGVHGRPEWHWRLSRSTTDVVWVSVETDDFLIDFDVDRIDADDETLGVSAHRVALNEHVRLSGPPGDYRLRLRFEPESRPAGTFTIRASRDAPVLPRESERHAFERVAFERALGRAGVDAAPAFRVTVLERLIRAWQHEGAWTRVLDAIGDAIAIRVAAGEFLDAAALLDDRARAQVELGRRADAIDTLDRSARMWLRAGDVDAAAARLAQAWAVCTRVPFRVARARLARAYRLAEATDQTGFAYEAIAQALEEEGAVREAFVAFDRAAVAHSDEGLERSAVLAAEDAARLFESHARDGWSPVTEAPGPMRRALEERLFAAVRSGDADRCRRIGDWGAAMLVRSDATDEAGSLQLELGYSLRRIRASGVLEAFRQAQRHFESAEDASGTGRALNEIALVLDRAGDSDAAVPLFERAFAHARSSGDDELRHWTAFNLGHHYAQREAWGPASDWFARVGELPSIGEGSTGFAHFLRQVVAAFRAANRPRDGLRFQQYVVGVYRARAMTRSLRRALVDLGDLALEAGDPAGAALAYAGSAPWSDRAIDGMSRALRRVAVVPR